MDPRYLHLLVCSAGLGLGNATRLGAVLQKLVEEGRARGVSVRATVFAWGRAVPHFRELAGSLPLECVEIPGYRSWGGRDGSGGLREVLRLLRFFPRFARNALRIRRWISRNRPDIVLLDSDYHLAGPRPRQMPVVFLGQAHEVIRYARSAGIRADGAGEWLSRELFERLDAWIQKRIADHVVVPCLDPAGAPSSPALLRVEPVVRPAFEADRSSGAPSHRAVVMTGGSGIGSEALMRWAEVRGIPVFSGKDSAASQADAEVLLGRMAAAEVLVVQGGLSSISEGVALNRPMMVVPIPGHFEQKCNALQVERLGLGMACSDPGKLGDEILEKLLLCPSPPRYSCGGAGEIARFLLELKPEI